MERKNKVTLGTVFFFNFEYSVACADCDCAD